MGQAETSHQARRNALENVVHLDPSDPLTRRRATRGIARRLSTLLVVTGEDPVFVVGRQADIRGLIVNDFDTAIRKELVVLRIQVSDILRPRGDDLTYSHRKEDRA